MKKILFTKKEEAAANIREKGGHYKDLSKLPIKTIGCHLSDIQMMDLLKNLRLRFTLTTHCNQECFFCSNEGSSYESKKKGYEMNIDDVIKLSEMFIKKTSLRKIDFSGGEPTLHSDFTSNKYKLIKWTRKHPRVRFSFHTNGINLTASLIDELKKSFSRIGISVHSFDFKKWNQVSNSELVFPEKMQKQKFNRLLDNLKYLSQQNIGDKIFIKSVIMKGVNDEIYEIKNFLRKCEAYGFHPKFLEFEPQFPEQKKYFVSREEFMRKLIKIGCGADYDESYDEDGVYIPATLFKFKNTPVGLHGVFRCGTKASCSACFSHLCMFVKEKEGGRGLCLKPCSVTDTYIDIAYALKRDDFKEIFKLFKMAREYLIIGPGLGVSSWREN